MALLLTRPELERLLDVGDAAAAMRAAAAACDGSPAHKVHAPVDGGSAVALLPGLLPHVPAYTVKVNAKFPEATPPIRGVVCLHDRADGRLLALLDSGFVTAARTGALAAVATDALAPPGAAAVAVVGCGAQNRSALRVLAHLRPLRRIVLHDVDREAAARLAADAASFAACEIADSAAAACAAAEIVLVATWPREPVVTRRMVGAGGHVASVGADELGKAELDRELLASAVLVVDDYDRAVGGGAVGTAGLSRDAIAADVGELVRGAHPGRTAPEQVTVFTSVGLPWQDLALAWLLYEAALAAGAGLAVDLG